MQSSPQFKPDPVLRSAFQQDGVVCLRGLIDPASIARLRTAVEDVMARPGPASKDIAQDGRRSGRFFSEIFPSLHNSTLRDFIFASPVAEVAAWLLESSEIRYFNDHLLVKEPGTDAPTPWHQDQPYFPCTGLQVCSVWLGLDPVERASGAMSFVRGSHRSGRLYRPANFGTGEAYDAAEDEFSGEVPDVESDPAAFPTVCYEMQPGDVTFHHARTLHGALGNSSATLRRRGYSIRLVGDDVTWHNPRYRPRGFKYLEEGQRLDDPFYPRLWPRP